MKCLWWWFNERQHVKELIINSAQAVLLLSIKMNRFALSSASILDFYLRWCWLIGCEFVREDSAWVTTFTLLHSPAVVRVFTIHLTQLSIATLPLLLTIFMTPPPPPPRTHTNWSSICENKEINSITLMYRLCAEYCHASTMVALFSVYQWDRTELTTTSLEPREPETDKELIRILRISEALRLCG